MLREEYLLCAAAVHMQGARFLRDAAAALLPCCTFTYPQRVLTGQSIFTQAEQILGDTADLSAGLLRQTTITKYTRIVEARMRLVGVRYDDSVYARTEAAERASAVAPGTRGEIYAGFRALSARAGLCAADFVRFADEAIRATEEGTDYLAVPLPALSFLRLLVADYGAACKRLAAGEEAKMLRRIDAAEKYERCLRHAAAAVGDGGSETVDGMTAKACSGHIPGLPPALFEICLRYEQLPATYGGAKTEFAKV